MKQIVKLIFLLLILSSCNSSKSSVNCDCVDVINSMNYTSNKYNKCIDIAIGANAEDPLEFFKSKCTQDRNESENSNLTEESNEDNMDSRIVTVKLPPSEKSINEKKSIQTSEAKKK
jgi:hypothetical protein